jgi:UDP-2,3-diacylglucosamine hydrolase
MYNVERKFLGEDKEWQMLYAKEVLKKEHFDYFLFGHRHIAIQIPIGENSSFINLGDWIVFNSYAVFDGSTCTLKYYEK